MRQVEDERDSALAAQEIAFDERNSALAERDFAFNESESAQAGRDLAFDERDCALDNRNSALADRDAIAERSEGMRQTIHAQQNLLYLLVFINYGLHVILQTFQARAQRDEALHNELRNIVSYIFLCFTFICVKRTSIVIMNLLLLQMDGIQNPVGVLQPNNEPNVS